jgi:hypothetical protein
MREIMTQIQFFKNEDPQHPSPEARACRATFPQDTEAEDSGNRRRFEQLA